MTVRHHASALLLAAVVLLIASFTVYKLLPIAGVALGMGSGVVAGVLIAHLVVLALLLIPFALRHRSRGRST